MKKILHAIKSFFLLLSVAVCTILFFVFFISAFIMPEDRILSLILMTLFLIIGILCFKKLVKYSKEKNIKVIFTREEKTTQPIITNTTKVHAPQNQDFFSLQLENEIRIMNESYELASKTLNIETFRMRFYLYLEKANLILNRTNNPQTIQQCKSLIADQDRLKARIVADLSKKAIEDTKKLKTQQGIINRLESVCNELQSATFLHDAPHYEEMISIMQKGIDDVKEVSFSAAYTQPKQDSPYSSFKPDYSKNIDDISEDAKKHSEVMHALHHKEFNSFDPFNLDSSLVDDSPLTSVEKSFLKYMDGNNVVNPYIPGYWTYEYNINYKKLLTIFLVKEYLKISSGTETLKFLTIEELKEILRKNNLKVSGKKNELINRIKENIEIPVLETMISKSSCKYILTPSGKNLTTEITASATKNIELEDKCLQLILISEFNGAYSEICNNELNKNISRGIMNWQYESIHGLSQNQINCFENLMSNQRIDFPDEIPNEHYSNAKACVILGNMLGVAVDKIYTMFCRVTKKTYNKAIVMSFLQKLQFDVMDSIQQN